MRGVLLVSGALEDGAYGANPGRGVLFGVATGLAYAAFLLVQRQGSMDLRRPAGALFDMSLVAALVTLAFGLALGVDDLAPTWPSAAWLVTLALTSQVLGWLLITVSLPRLPAAMTSMILTLQPVASVVLGAILLGQEPSVLQFGGVALILFGLVSVGTMAGAVSPGAEADAPPLGRDEDDPTQWPADARCWARSPCPHLPPPRRPVGVPPPTPTPSPARRRRPATETGGRRSQQITARPVAATGRLRDDASSRGARRERAVVRGSASRRFVAAGARSGVSNGRGSCPAPAPSTDSSWPRRPLDDRRFEPSELRAERGARTGSRSSTPTRSGGPPGRHPGMSVRRTHERVRTLPAAAGR